MTFWFVERDLAVGLHVIRLILGFSLEGGGGLAEGSVISRLFIICGVVMMKITSSTNTRSSSGVMFSSCIVP